MRRPRICSPRKDHPGRGRDPLRRRSWPVHLEAGHHAGSVVHLGLRLSHQLEASSCTLPHNQTKERIFNVFFFFILFLICRGEYELRDGTSASVFTAVLEYYRSGVIHCPPHVSVRQLCLNQLNLLLCHNNSFLAPPASWILKPRNSQVIYTSTGTRAQLSKIIHPPMGVNRRIRGWVRDSVCALFLSPASHLRM